MTDALTVDVRHDEGVARVVLTGELDAATSGILRSAVERALERDDTARLVVDLTQVAFVDSSGLRAILQAKMTSAEVPVDVRVSPTSAVARMFVMTGVGDFLLDDD